MAWTLNDIPWHEFDPTRVDPDILAVIKAAAMVEKNSADYATYLANVFSDDPVIPREAERWGREEIQHGDALGRWAELADPSFDFAARFRRFQESYRIPVESEASVRGSRSGELIARCMVETATSGMYSALRDATDEPVLKAICHKIAGDEYRHYKLFYDNLQRYLPIERPTLPKRIYLAIERYRETEDDELATAYHCANMNDQPYERSVAGSAFFWRYLSCYRQRHLQRVVSMALRAVGLQPQGRLSRAIERMAWPQIGRMVQRYRRRAREHDHPGLASSTAG